MYILHYHLNLCVIELNKLHVHFKFWNCVCKVLEYHMYLLVNCHYDIDMNC